MGWTSTSAESYNRRVAKTSIELLQRTLDYEADDLHVSADGFHVARAVPKYVACTNGASQSDLLGAERRPRGRPVDAANHVYAQAPSREGREWHDGLKDGI